MGSIATPFEARPYSTELALCGSPNDSSVLGFSRGLTVTDINGGPLAGFRNLIINGGLTVNQRNFSSSSVPVMAVVYTFDRIYVATETTAVGTATKQPQTYVTGLGVVTPLRFTWTTAGSSVDTTNICQVIEDVNLFPVVGKTLTLSFYARANRAIPGQSTCFYVSNMSSSNNTYVLSTSWARYTAQFIITSPYTFSGNRCLLQIFRGTGQSIIGDWVELAGVQLELGTQATPFENRPYSIELALCQRYYYRIYPGVGAGLLGEYAYMLTDTLSQCITHFPVQMRIAPSALEQSGSVSDYRVVNTDSVVSCSAVPTFNRASQYYANTAGTVASGLTIGRAGEFRTANANGFLGWSAEL